MSADCPSLEESFDVIRSVFECCPDIRIISDAKKALGILQMSRSGNRDALTDTDALDLIRILALLLRRHERPADVACVVAETFSDMLRGMCTAGRTTRLIMIIMAIGSL
jgi:hypothetical protein